MKTPRLWQVNTAAKELSAKRAEVRSRAESLVCVDGASWATRLKGPWGLHTG